jgi:polyphosphate kinase
VINEGLRLYLEDNTQAWQMGEDGQYVCRVPGRNKPVAAQESLLDLLARKSGA